MSKPAFQAATRCCADARAKSIRFMRDFPFGLMFMVQIKFSRSFPRFSSHRLVCQSSLSTAKIGFFRAAALFATDFCAPTSLVDQRQRQFTRIDWCFHALFIQPPARTVGRKRSMAVRMVRNNSRGTATSAIWKTTCRECRTTLAPILINFSRRVVNVQCRTDLGSTACRRKLPRL